MKSDAARVARVGRVHFNPPSRVECGGCKGSRPTKLIARRANHFGVRQWTSPALFAKIFRLTRLANQNYTSRHPVPGRGALAIVTNVGAGCGGRGSVARETGLRGGLCL